MYNLKKDYICQEGVIVVNWAQIHNQSLEAIADRGFPCAVHFREKPQTELPSFGTVFLPSEFTLVREFLVSSSNPWAETCLILLLHSYIFICIYTDQSEQLHDDQSEHMMLTHQDSAVWTNQTVPI